MKVTAIMITRNSVNGSFTTICIHQWDMEERETEEKRRQMEGKRGEVRHEEAAEERETFSGLKSPFGSRRLILA